MVEKQRCAPAGGRQATDAYCTARDSCRVRDPSTDGSNRGAISPLHASFHSARIHYFRFDVSDFGAKVMMYACARGKSFSGFLSAHTTGVSREECYPHVTPANLKATPGRDLWVNMAATLPKILSFAKNTRTFLTTSRLSAVPVQRYSVPVSSYGEKITHTGQVFDQNDFRRARFEGRQKEVNQNFAIQLVAEEPVSNVEAPVVSCDGGGGALGHPKVYINLDKMTKVGTCGYCGCQFQHKHHH